MSNPTAERLKTLEGFLESDPDNPALLADVAAVALEADALEKALEYFQKLDSIESLKGGTANAAGIAAMRNGDPTKAQEWFAVALEGSAGDPGTLFNIAWARSLDGDFDGSADLLTEEVTSALAQAATLDMQISHEQGRFDDAEAKMHAYLELHPEYEPLHAAASVLAMDIDRPDLARACAMKSANHPDAQTTLGTLDLGNHDLEKADKKFDAALASGRKNPRAEIGKGLVALARGDHRNAAEAIDRGAKQFGEHLGSWIAAGWAYFLMGEIGLAKDRFQVALDLDQSFGETHGSLAVIDVMEGNIEEAKRKSQVSMRLDAQGFSGALATILIAQTEERPEKAEALLQRAMGVPILPDGSTLEQAIIKSMTSPKVQR